MERTDIAAGATAYSSRLIHGGLRYLEYGEFALVRESLDQLEEPCREIVELRYLGDLSYEELGATLKLNPKTVSSRLSRCLDRLEEIARKTFSRDKPGISRPTEIRE